MNAHVSATSRSRRPLAEPDPLGIRYREPLIHAVQAIVRDRKVPSAENIQQLTDELVPENDRKAFQQNGVGYPCSTCTTRVMWPDIG